VSESHGLQKNDREVRTLKFDLLASIDAGGIEVAEVIDEDWHTEGGDEGRGAVQE
jgi:hypothetical protein